MTQYKAFFAEFQVVEYRQALELQLKLLEEKKTGLRNEDIVLCLEHTPVFTLGRRGGMENLLVSESFLNDRNIEIIQVERGGNITYHGPGQLVVYPIVDLKRLGIGVAEYVRKLEEIMIQTARKLGVDTTRDELNRGVWARGKKLGNVGVAISRDISFHGFSLNINVSIEPFRWINPCGLKHIQITTLEMEGAGGVTVQKVRRIIKRKIEDTLGLNLVNMTSDYLMSPSNDKPSINLRTSLCENPCG